MSSKGRLKRGIRDLERVESRVGPDSIKLWDSYEEQCLLWRAIALLQMPAIVFAAILCTALYFYSDQVVEAPQRPEPGYLSVSDISDYDIIQNAVRLVNLITRYRPKSAERQFELARKYLWEPALTAFNNEYLGNQLKIIRQTVRSQVFFPSNRQVKITRVSDSLVTVRVPGRRQKIIGDVPMRPDEIAWYIDFTTIPRNEINEFGLVAIDMRPKVVSLKKIAQEDAKEAARARKKKK